MKLFHYGENKGFWIVPLIDYIYIMTSQFISQSHGYPSGVPDAACDSMFPSGHQSSASHQPPPYDISLTKSHYQPGETLQVKIQSQPGEYFTGFYVQARRVGCYVNKTQTVGVFTSASNLAATRHCFGKVHTAVSHNSGVKKDSVSFYWTAPVISAGHIAIRATIVKDKKTFWTDVESLPLLDFHDADTPYCIGGGSHSNSKYQSKKRQIIPDDDVPTNAASIKTSTILPLLLFHSSFIPGIIAHVLSNILYSQTPLL